MSQRSFQDSWTSFVWASNGSIEDVCRERKQDVEASLAQLEQLAAEINHATRRPRPVGRPIGPDRIWMMKNQFLRTYRELQAHFLEYCR